MHTLAPILALLGDLGGGEMLIIFFVILILFGGQRLPELARSLGKSMREFKKASEGVEREIKRAIEDAPAPPAKPKPIAPPPPTPGAVASAAAATAMPAPPPAPPPLVAHAAPPPLAPIHPEPPFTEELDESPSSAAGGPEKKA